MRALWLVRKNLWQHTGGDTTQIVETARALRARKVTVDLSNDPHPEFTGYDVVHLFHLDRLWDHALHCSRLRRQGRPAVLSPIYWPADRFDRAGRRGVQGVLSRMLGSSRYPSLRILQRSLMRCWEHPRELVLGTPMANFHRAVRSLLNTVSVLLPNSRAEREIIARRFSTSQPAVVVPNGAAVSTFWNLDRDWPGGRDGVLCVGRIEPRKNQLALIRAMRDSDMRLTFVGRAGRYSSAYAKRCRREAGPNVRFLGQRDAAELCKLYQSSVLHTCVSWYETPGLVNLEAALCGCAIVTTSHGCTHEYFGNEAEYCEPDGPDSIRGAIERALAGPPSSVLAGRVAAKYNWDAAAEKTLEGYCIAIQSPQHLVGDRRLSVGTALIPHQSKGQNRDVQPMVS